MNIEIVEFYPLELNKDKGFLRGTLRVRLPDLGLHILGIYVKKQKEFWYFMMPGREAISNETGEWIRYPFIVFEDRDRQRALIEAIRKRGRAFIEQRLADTENPLIFPKKQENDQNKSKYQSTCDKETAAPAIKAKLVASILDKEWRDPPKRKTIPVRGRR